MLNLSNLRNTDRPAKTSRRVGRGVGCKRGKTCGRGAKGDKSRSGYKRRYGKEGGQLPLYRKLPTRGFGNSVFEIETYAINLARIHDEFQDGDMVSLAVLQAKKIAPRRAQRLKILGGGELSKKLTIEAHQFSSGAENKLAAAQVSYRVIS